MRKKSWSKEDLVEAARKSTSIRQVLKKLNLKEAGGNYAQIKKFIAYYKIDTSRFKGKGWSRGMKLPFVAKRSLKNILVKDSDYQSYKLKARLIRENIKKRECEICGWATRSKDGRIPLEIDHINGDSRDNRLENLRVLCPNCHSLQPTHRGRNRK